MSSLIRRFVARVWCRFAIGHYLSTACYHEEHGDCRRKCKFCSCECACKCHAGDLPLVATGVTYP